MRLQRRHDHEFDLSIPDFEGMNTHAATNGLLPGLSVGSADVFLRADPRSLYEWVVRQRARLIWFCIGLIIVGSGVYGASIGIWREPLQAFYTGIKLPL